MPHRTSAVPTGPVITDEDRLRTHGSPGRDDGVFARRELTLPPTLAAVAPARAAVRSLRDDVAADVLADAELLVCELVTNSVRHGALATDGFVRVRLAVGLGRLQVEVEDSGTTGKFRLRPAGFDGEGGFGLQIVAALARRWGVVQRGGTRVWVELVSEPVAA
jgi:anti-sigma regulatory factor (Ser/Thr protein kinase)